MKRKILCCFIALTFFAVNPATTYADEVQAASVQALSPVDIISDAAVLMDAKTGQIIFDKNSGQRMYPASTTKIMTGMLATEGRSMNEMAEVTQSAVDIDEWDSANIALVSGERLTVDSLMYALMLPSANDAANVLAEHVAGSQQKFVEMMNDCAAEIGAVDTHFVNPHGLHDDDHYTTARDMALITRAAIKNPVFMQYFSSGTHTIPATNMQSQQRNFTNYNYMLVNTTRFYDPSVAGGKVGYTMEARHTMSTVAVRGGRTLICVVLSSPNRYDKFSDTKKLFDFGFGEFEEINVTKAKIPGFSTMIMDGETELGRVKFSTPRDFTALVYKGANMSTYKMSYSHEQPFDAYEEISSYAEFTVESGNPAVPNMLGRLELDADTSLFVQAASAVLHIKGDLSEQNRNGNLRSILLALAGIAVVAVASMFAARQVSLARTRKRRRERLERLQRERGQVAERTVGLKK